MVDEAMVTAWREAATRLGVRVIAPYGVDLADGTTLLVEAFLPDFGGQYGAIAVALEDPDRCRQAAKANRFVSQLSPTYRHFDDERFRNILNDWGWWLARDLPELVHGRALVVTTSVRAMGSS